MPDKLSGSFLPFGFNSITSGTDQNKLPVCLNKVLKSHKTGNDLRLGTMNPVNLLSLSLQERERERRRRKGSKQNVRGHLDRFPIISKTILFAPFQRGFASDDWDYAAVWFRSVSHSGAVSHAQFFTLQYQRSTTCLTSTGKQQWKDVHLKKFARSLL